ncbi:MAG: tRNA isopentenyl-2-thiomethyl-A-37 hydroxylase MiaE [Pseudohongiellaceae bacterium]
MTERLLESLLNFLSCPTPESWLELAARDLETLLVDHANCEKKAAATAMNLMYRYVDKSELLQKMSQLAREELLHFEQVVKTMQDRNIAYIHLGPSRYAASLRDHIRTHEPARLTDTLIIGAFVEARSCERFAALIPYLDDQLAKFYRSLLKSESRHFLDYLELARLYANEDITARVAFFARQEAALIRSSDTEFRFHSGTPSGGMAASVVAE